MASYKVEFTQIAEKELNKIDKQYIPKILAKIKSLKNDPFTYSRKLKAKSGYRLRAGDYRIIFDIFENQNLISIFKIAHRKDAYR